MLESGGFYADGIKAEAAAFIDTAGAKLAGLVVALDRQEVIAGGQTALERLKERLGVPVIGIAALPDIIAHFRAQESGAARGNLAALLRHQECHCQRITKGRHDNAGGWSKPMDGEMVHGVSRDVPAEAPSNGRPDPQGLR